ncbi:MAG TPA: lysophospholipid acyltransferase family protein [Mycobacteriales bacterium]|jgi:1-acyl-sn-glycerol-3-phosphate acyltransferase
MAELVYRPVIGAALAAFKALDLRIDVRGAEHLPATGGAVIASNHVSYVDFVFTGLAARQRDKDRLVRFLAKKEIFDKRLPGLLMRGMGHIPVDRSAGAGSYRDAVAALRGGELIGMFPEATISRSFCLKEFKNGAARMAIEAGVPLVPSVVWGTQRLLTKGRKRELVRHVPVLVRVGAPLHPGPGDDATEVTVVLKERMQALLDEAVAAYPESPAGAWWLPAHLGGGAPTPEEVAAGR